MHVESSLAAHFKQADGPSLPGVSWLIGIEHGGRTYHARVKALLAADTTKTTRKDETYQAQTAMQYLAHELDSGWHPSQEREHTIHIGNPSSRRAWWKFW
ncbi:MAG: hypothetical protein ABI781_04145 [Burkholderiales bacterium]